MQCTCSIEEKDPTILSCSGEKCPTIVTSKEKILHSTGVKWYEQILPSTSCRALQSNRREVLEQNGLSCAAPQALDCPLVIILALKCTHPPLHLNKIIKVKRIILLPPTSNVLVDFAKLPITILCRKWCTGNGRCKSQENNKKYLA